MNAMVQQHQSTSMALVPQSMGEAMRLADYMSDANLIPDHLKGKPGDCLMVVMQAQRWGMDALSVAQCTSVVRGKLCYEGKLVAAVLISMGVIKDELDYEFSGSGDARRVLVTGTLRNGKVKTVEGTVDQWKTTNDAWKRDADQMLTYRGARQWARRWAPSAMLGVYTPDEMEDVNHAAPVTVTQAASNDSGRTERTAYPEESFAANLTKWGDVIKSGRKSADDIIAMAETKGSLSEGQKAVIRAFETIEGEIVDAEMAE